MKRVDVGDPRAVLDSLARLLSVSSSGGGGSAGGGVPTQGGPLPAFSDGPALLATATAAAALAPEMAARARPSAATAHAVLAAQSLASGLTLTPLPLDRLPTAAAFGGVLRGDAAEDQAARAQARASLILQGIYAGEADG